VDADKLNGLAEDEAAARLRECCAASAWVAGMLAGRPYASGAEVRAHGARLLDHLDWDGIQEALDAHPRIGQRVTGTGQEAAWSRREQAGTADSTDEVKAALVAANRAYEERFGHVFLIFASGKSDVEMLAAAQARVEHADAHERTVVRGELGRIVDLRLQRMLES